jgi:hypothetical protein
MSFLGTLLPLSSFEKKTPSLSQPSPNTPVLQHLHLLRVSRLSHTYKNPGTKLSASAVLRHSTLLGTRIFICVKGGRAGGQISHFFVCFKGAAKQNTKREIQKLSSISSAREGGGGFSLLCFTYPLPLPPSKAGTVGVRETIHTGQKHHRHVHHNQRMCRQ